MVDRIGITEHELKKNTITSNLEIPECNSLNKYLSELSPEVHDQILFEQNNFEQNQNLSQQVNYSQKTQSG